MDLDLSGKHALVCGASAGIGFATAVELAKLGADVTILARSADDALVAKLPRVRDTQHHGALRADVGDTAALRAAVESLAREKPVAILVNNTAGPPGGPALAAAPEAFLDTFTKHLVANQVLAQCVADGMKTMRYGRIVNVISTSVKEPIKNLGVSNTVRGAVASWAKTLAAELGPFGITVNNVLPGYTRTQRLDQIVGERSKAAGKPALEIEQTMLATVPAGRFAQASEIASVIAFLASPAAAYVSGVNVPVDGGRTQSL